MRSVLAVLSMKTRDMAYAALFAGMIAVSALISIPTPLVPFTLQPFAITLCALVLPRKTAVLAVSIYCISGFLGLPVFSGGNGGIQTLLKPTLGFIIGFIPMTYVISSFKSYKFHGLRFISMVLGFIALYSIGLSVLYFNLRYVQEIMLPISKLFVMYCFVYLPTDFLSFLSASLMSDRLRRLKPKH